MACSAHKPNGVHDGYINFSEQLVNAFRERGLMLSPSQRDRQLATARRYGGATGRNLHIDVPL
jgi:hypothetical protein